MHRIDSATKAPDLFGAGKDGWKDGNKALGIIATDMTAAFFNDVQENIAQLIEAGGDALVKGDYTQLLTTLLKKGLQGNYFSISAAGGTADAITGSYAPGIAELANGLTLHVRATAANATTTPTFTPASPGIAPTTIVKGNNLPLAIADIPGAGYWAAFRYDLTLNKWVLLNPATGVNGFGFGQTWENVIGSRALSTTYYNTTDRPILVAVTGTNNGANPVSMTLSINGVVVGSPYLYGGASNSAQPFVSGIVPPGGSYSITGSNASLLNWAELR